MIELVQIPKENTDTVWHLCKGMIANALARSNGYASETHFKKWIKDEKMQLWFLWDSELDIQDRLYGVVVTEVVFNYPGLGRLVIESISNRDLPTVQALAIILASIYVSINLIADLLTLTLNPRLKSLQIRK